MDNGGQLHFGGRRIATATAVGDRTAGKPAGYTGKLNHDWQILHEIEAGKARARTSSDEAQPMG